MATSPLDKIRFRSTDKPKVRAKFGKLTERRSSIDWRSWVALAWAAWFGVLYARMVLEERAPKALRAIERVIDSIGPASR